MLLRHDAMTNYSPPKLVELVTTADYTVGLETAPITIVEYGDYECPHCGYFHQIISQLLHELGSRVRYVFRHFPISSIHPNARRAAQAVEAAAEQGKFWQMHNTLFDNQKDLSRKNLQEYAERLGLDLKKFSLDLDSDMIANRIDDDIELGVKSGVNGTPTLFVNDTRYDGAWDLHSLSEFIDKPFGLKIQVLTQRFTDLAVSGGILLFLFTILALILSNSSLSDQYLAFWSKDFALIVGGFELRESLLHIVNDGLMAIFFFVVGLEIKREVLIGELSERKKAMLPVFAAIGGIVVPTTIYVLINWGNAEKLAGWAIPMATDIAFLLVILTFFDKRIPASLRIFFSALAIVDDLAAILVISIFYTDQLEFAFLGAGLSIVAILFVINRFRIYSSLPYLVLGLVLWYMFLESGIHPTIAGVILAFTIPTREPPDTKILIAQCNTLMIDPHLGDFTEDSLRHAALQTLETITERLQSPSQRLEHDVQPWTVYLILPIFALANAGISLSGTTSSLLTSSVTLGIILGLVIGKPLGIILFAWIAVKLNVAQLPGQVSWKDIFAISWLAGIGFTMSLFIAGIAFEDETLASEAKIGILIASAIAALLGLIIGLLLTKQIGEAYSDV